MEDGVKEEASSVNEVPGAVRLASHDRRSCPTPLPHKDGVLVIEGPSGIGKTELLRRTRALARERGFLALWATGAEVERDFVYGVVRQLFERPLAQASSEQRASLLSGAASLARIAFESVPGPL